MQTKIRNWLLSGLAVAIFVISGCNSPQNAPTASAGSPTPPAATASSPPPSVAAATTQAFSNLPRLEGKATVSLTVKGSPITIQVDGTDAPITAGNFVDLVERKVYDGLVFHRVVKEPQPFVVQGGDPQGKNPNFPVEQLGTGGFIDPATNQPRNIPLEIKPEKSDQLIYSRTFQMAGVAQTPKLKHTRGAVAMARSQFPDSASSQFYIALNDLPFLDGDYAVFGYVTEGMETVDKIQQGDRIDSAKVTQGLENLKNAASPSPTPGASPSPTPGESPSPSPTTSP